MKLDSDTVIFITGAGSGFGLACAIKYYDLGCKVILADIAYTHESLKFIEKCDQSRIIVLKDFDVTKEESIVSNLALAVAKFKNIDILLNSAGVASIAYTLTKSGQLIDNKEIMRILLINVVGTINVSKYVAKHMISSQQTKDRVIINVASVAALEGSRGQVAYSLSKGAVVGITLPMARDLGRYNIRVVTLAPAIFDTPMGQSIPKQSTEIMLRHNPLGRLGDPNEFADAVVNICESTYLTGCVIRIDGGIRVPHL